MERRATRILEWLRARAENFACALLAAMFVAFLIQIAFRYLLNLPIGWTHEISVVTWIWLVLFGSAFVVREREEIRFDLIYGSVRDRSRRFMGLITAAALIVLFGMSLPAVVDYVTFMRIERTAYLKIRFDYLYSIYVVFAVAMIVRYIWIAWEAVWGRAPEAYDPTKAGSGV